MNNGNTERYKYLSQIIPEHRNDEENKENTHVTYRTAFYFNGEIYLKNIFLYTLP